MPKRVNKNDFILRLDYQMKIVHNWDVIVMRIVGIYIGRYNFDKFANSKNNILLKQNSVSRESKNRNNDENMC